MDTDNSVKTEKTFCNGEGEPCNRCLVCKEDARQRRQEQRDEFASSKQKGRQEYSKSARRGSRRDRDY